MTECKFPDVLGRSSYSKGCRCQRCRDDHNAARKQWRKDNPEKDKAASRRKYLKHRAKVLVRSREYRYQQAYGLSAEEADLMKQRGCAMCGVSEAERTMCIDHDHTTGEVRDVLCLNCNIVVGILEKRADELEMAATYLEKHSVELRTS